MSLSRVQSVRLAAVLEDCSNQLDILGHTLSLQIDREQGSAAAKVIPTALSFTAFAREIMH